MTTDISKIRAVILAGGKGTRLRPLTAVFPKPLVPLGNRPIIEILLTRLANSGFKDVTLSTGYLAELIMAVCGDGSKYGLNISYSSEEAPLGTAAPLSLMSDLTDPVIVMNGDLLTTLNFRQMIDFHKSEGADVTIGCFKRDVSIDFGVVQSNDRNEFVGFREKPTDHFEVSMGVNVISQAAREYIVPNQYLDMPNLILKVYQEGGKVSCFREDCYWLDIGRMDDYALAQDEFVKNEAMFLGST
ncbi:MAG: sugar phosphate nucleotidyltransferase [Candidatus Thiodiazotropha sp.]